MTSFSRLSAVCGGTISLAAGFGLEPVSDGMIMSTSSPDVGHTDGPPAVPRLMQRLHDLAQDREVVSIACLTREIGAQGHAPLLMVAAVFMILPIGMIPGIGGALGVIVAIIGLQMLLGRKGLWMPAPLGRRKINAERIRTATQQIRPAADWIRRHLHPRWEMLSNGNISLSLIAVLLIVTGASLLILGAIPVATPLIGLPVAVFAVGLLGRDGMVVAAGYILIALIIAGIWLWRSSTG
ncbi:exopolysaccharide biosynthesis protein [Roseovarius sp. B08]|uniref:exopolysaccharide biosynthesis protein n=1 Tax=Roseovarius sp. B08 TaxID=3449223 RepID=UPI003EDC7F99